MNKAFTLIALTAVSPALALDITVEVSNLKSDGGALVVQVYDSKDTWLSENTVAREHRPLKAGDKAGTVAIPINLEPGRYALSVYHDENDNGKLDANFIGIPKEPVGLSNDHRPKFGPPSYDKAALSIDADQVIEITLD